MDPQTDLFTRVADYLRAHHTMSLATISAQGDGPHAASVFYAADEGLRLIFLSQATSLHGEDIGSEAPVAATVSEDYDDWRLIQGVQLWGRARLLDGATKAKALAHYLTRFPFVGDLLREPGLAARLLHLGVYSLEAERAGFTDNTSGVFGKETLEWERYQNPK